MDKPSPSASLDEVVHERVVESFGFLKTTAIGGVLFLLPVAVILGLLGYVYQAVVAVYEPLKEHVHVSSPVGVALLFFASVAILVVLCFFGGIAARRAFAKRVTRRVEKQLVTLFPKYAIIKDVVAGNLGGADGPALKPVTVRLVDMVRVGFEAGRTVQGMVIVYLPGSPDPWIGTVALVEPARVETLDVDFNETAAICERLGRDSSKLLASVKPEPS